MAERLIIAMCEESYERYINGDFIDKHIGAIEVQLLAWSILEKDPVRSKEYQGKDIIPALVTHNNSLGDNKKFIFSWVSDDDIEVEED